MQKKKILPTWGKGPFCVFGKRIILILCFFLYIFIGLFVYSAHASSGINRQINFQGKLVNPNGTNVADGSYTIVFSLYTVSSGGTNIWTESDSVTTKDGIFQVALGATTTFASANVDFNQTPLYLGIKVGSDAEMTPRVQFAAVPYAFNAEKVSGLTVTNNGGNTLNIAANKTFTVNNTVTIAGTDGNTYTLPAVNNGTVLTTNQTSQTVNSGQTSGTIFAISAGAPSLAGSLTGLSITTNGTGAQNQTGLAITVSGASGSNQYGLTVSDGTNTNTILDKSGNLTLGNASHTTGSLVLANAAAAGTTTINIGNQGATNLTFTLPTTAGGNGNVLTTNGSGVLSWTSSGSIGGYWQLNSGVISPSTISNQLAIGQTTALASAGLDVEYNSLGNAATVVNNTGGLGDIFTASSAGTTEFRIDSGGNVGIASGTKIIRGIYLGAAQTTTTPHFIYLSDVSNASSGYALLTGNWKSNGNGGWGIGPATNSTTDNTLRIGLTSLATGTWTATQNLSLLLGGTVGNSALSQSALDIEQNSLGNSALVVNNSGGAGDIFTASSSGTPEFVINKNGNVGVGTTLPTAVLDVVGNASESGNLTFRGGGAQQINLLNNSSLAIGTSVGGDSGITANRPAIYIDSSGNVSFGVNSTVTNALGLGVLGTASSPKYFLAAQNSNSVGSASYMGRWQSSSPSNFWGIGPATANNDNMLRIGNAISQGNSQWSTTQNLTLVLGGQEGIGQGTNTSLLGTLDVRNVTGTLATASISGQTSFAALTVDNSGLGDLFTASSAGLSRFVITQNGNVGIGTALPTSDLHLATSDTTGTLFNITNTAGTGTIIGESISVTGSATSNTGLQVTAGNAGTNNIFVGKNAARTVATLNGNGALTLGNGGNNTGQLILAVNGGGNTGTTTIQAGASGATNLTLTLPTTAGSSGQLLSTNGSGTLSWASDMWQLNSGVLSPSTISNQVAIGQTTALASSGLDIEVNSLGNAAEVVNNTGGAGDIFTASSAGTPEFVINKNGNVGIGNMTPAYPLEISKARTGNDTLLTLETSGNGHTSDQSNILFRLPGSVGTLRSVAEISAIDQNVNNTVPGILTFSTSTGTDNLLERMRIDNNGSVFIGATSGIASVGLDVEKNSLGDAAEVVNNTGGAGDIFTASSAGTTVFKMDSLGGVLFSGDTITASGSGSIGNGSNAIVSALGDQGSMIPNSGFESSQLNANPADGWNVAATTSANAKSLITNDSTTVAKGSHSAKVVLNNPTNKNIAFYSTCIPASAVTSGATYNLFFYAKATTQTPTLRAYIDQYSTKAGCQNDTSSNGIITEVAPAAITTSWAQYGTSATALTANTTWVRIHFLVGCTTAACTTETVNLDGVRFVESSLASGVDYAENYPADPNNMAEPGDVVSLQASGSASVVVPAHTAMDNSAIGVVSTHPAEVLDDGTMGDAKVSVALAGRIPVKVSTENGPIHVGDYLTSSDIPGVAVKAVNAGPIIGTAMQDYDGNTCPNGVANPHDVCQITMFVKNSYTNGNASVFTSTMTSDDLQFLGSLVQASQTSVDLTSITNLSKNQVVAGLEVLNNKVSDLETHVSSLSANLSVLGASSSAETLSPFASSSGIVSIDGLSINQDATVSADLRVKGNGLFEGILSVIDTFKANDIIVTGISEFFNTVVFHTDVTFEGRPTFNADTAGFAVIKKGSDHIDVQFDKPYDSVPVVNATLNLSEIISPTGTIETSQEREQTLFNTGYAYVIEKTSMKGFTIVLNKLADQDIQFSWTAISINQPKVFGGTGENVSPTPVSIISPTSFFTPNASESAN